MHSSSVSSVACTIPRWRTRRSSIESSGSSCWEKSCTLLESLCSRLLSVPGRCILMRLLGVVDTDMSSKTPYLTQPFGGYHASDVLEEDEELTHVGPRTPCGEYLRKFWQPVAHVEDLGDLPVPIRILGEDLVVFRDLGGRVGLLARHCAHRGTSLEYGILAERGIQCCYHGWHFDVDGRILDTPGEPADSTIKERLCIGAYPTREYGGLVFSYMGPPEAKPAFPIFDTFELPGYELGHGEPLGIKNVKPCNWLQIMDNVVDPVHEAFLHARSSGYQFLDKNGDPVTALADVGQYDFIETPIGIACQVTRRVGGDVWVRTIEYISPNIAQIPRTPAFPFQYPEGRNEICFVPWVTRWRVPMDDTNTLEFAFVRLRPGEENTYITDPGPVVLANYGGRSDAESRRYPGDYEAQISQRAIARHAHEHLGATDRGVTMMRRMIRRGIRAVAQGEDPVGNTRPLNGAIATYGNDTVVRVDPAASPEDDATLLRQIARDVAARALNNRAALFGTEVHV